MEGDARSGSDVPGEMKPVERVPLFKPAFVWRVAGFLAFMALSGGVSIIVGRPEPIVAYVVIAPLVLIGGAYVRAIRGKRMTEEEDEAEWAERRRRNEQVLEEAREKYAEGPVGGWQIYIGMVHRMGGPTVKERRVIEFQVEGKGRYRAFDAGGLALVVDVEFEFMSAEPEHMKVKLAKPALEGWRDVEFGFEIDARSGEPELKMWMESENPMPQELRELWPFRGEYVQERP